MAQDKAREEVGLPPRVFLYTIDQIAFLFSMDEGHIKRRMIHYDGRSVGAPDVEKMLAVNIAPNGETPVWRVPENRLIGYMKRHGIKYYERGYSKRDLL